jgi:alpha-D-ribose 1-methylphosphonate 5-triphosphate synthase subunit PhnH
MSAIPSYTYEESRQRETFLAVIWALSYPGRMQSLPDARSSLADMPVNSFLLIAEALLDLETNYYTADSQLDNALQQTGARSLSPSEAAYHFYPTLNSAAFEGLAKASVGTMLRPDEAATVIIAGQIQGGSTQQWRGPGIDKTIQVGVRLPMDFWALRTSQLRYPLGWDVIIVDGLQVIGLPRSTEVMIE